MNLTISSQEKENILNYIKSIIEPKIIGQLDDNGFEMMGIRNYFQKEYIYNDDDSDRDLLLNRLVIFVDKKSDIEPYEEIILNYET